MVVLYSLAVVGCCAAAARSASRRQWGWSGASVGIALLNLAHFVKYIIA